MKMRITILSASVNPDAYNLMKLSRMSYDEAKQFFDNDQKQECNVREYVVNQNQEHEATFHSDGVFGGDGSDAMLNWIKVCKDITDWL